MTSKQLKNILRTPRGILLLFAFTFFVSAILALIAANHRSFFEKYVVEKYPPTLESTAKLVRNAAATDSLPKDLPASTHQLLYEYWMTSSDSLDPHLPQKMFAAAPAIYLERVRRTFAAGSTAQKMRAAAFLKASQHSQAIVFLENEKLRALRRREFDLANALNFY